ncbi:MAG: ABC transporter ATP-binding protein [Saprospiraceae bacterium]
MDKPINRFWHLLENYRKEIRQIYLFGVLIGVINLTLPLGIQAIINFLQAGTLSSTWVLLVIFVLVGILIGGILQIMQLRVVENSQQNLFARSAFEFAVRLPRISYIEFDRMHAPEVTNRFFDTLEIQKGVPKIIIDFSGAIFQIVFGLIILTIYSPYFILLGVALIFVIWLTVKFLGSKGLEASLLQSKYKYKLVYWLEEIARNVRIFKLYDPLQFHIRKTDNLVLHYIESRESYFKVLLDQFKLFLGFKIFVAAGFLLLGGLLVFNQQMNIGQFVAAEIIIILILNSIEKLLSTLDSIYDVLTALEKIGFVADLALDQKGGNMQFQSEKGMHILAKDITFGFPHEKFNVFNDVSFEILPNEKVVLKGRSGSGKSVLLNLLSGIYTVEEGEIYIDNVPIHNYNQPRLQGSIGLNFPINQIFEGSLKENIIVGRQYDESTLMEVLNILNLSDYIIHLPHGLDYHVESGGRSLPRSVIQKIQLARVILTRPTLVLLEEPLHFVDEDDKRRIIEYLTHRDRNWTLIVVSDYEHWLKSCTRVLELN